MVIDRLITTTARATRSNVLVAVGLMQLCEVSNGSLLTR